MPIFAETANPSAMGYSYNPSYVSSFREEDPLFFTSDTHFSEEAIIRLCGRPFPNADEMDSKMVELWNGTVPKDGIVFHLGDFCAKGKSRWEKILSQLNGEIHLILGNHDLRRITPEVASLFASVSEQKQIKVGEQRIYLNHYPFLCYGGSYRDVWQLFGHVHTGPGHTGLDDNRLGILFPMQYDVGVDNNGYRPVSFAQVKEKILSQMINHAEKDVTLMMKTLSRFTPEAFTGDSAEEVRDSLTRAMKEAAIPTVTSREEVFRFLCPHRYDRIFSNTVYKKRRDPFDIRIRSHSLKNLSCYSAEVSDGVTSCGVISFSDDSTEEANV